MLRTLLSTLDGSVSIANPSHAVNIKLVSVIASLIPQTLDEESLLTPFKVNLSLAFGGKSRACLVNVSRGFSKIFFLLSFLFLFLLFFLCLLRLPLCLEPLFLDSLLHCFRFY